MEKSHGVPDDVPHRSQPTSPPAAEYYKQYPEAVGAPPAYNESAYPQAGYVPPGAGYPPPAAGYPPPAAGYPPPGQGYHAQAPGYAGPVQGYGYPQQQFHYSNVVVSQPLIGSQPISGPPPRDHMCAAIFVTLCCFWPTGIVAILRASDARNALARGDVAGANHLANSAKSMITISVIVGIIIYVMMAIFVGVYVGVVLNTINRIHD